MQLIVCPLNYDMYVAIELKVPLIAATDLGDKTMVDVERYDLGGVEPFLENSSAKQFELPWQLPKIKT